MSDTAAPTLADLRPGDILVTTIGGFIPGFFPVALGQAVVAPSEARRTREHWWDWRHIAVVVEGSVRRNVRDLPMGDMLNYDSGYADTWPRLVQAMPSGAEEIPMRPAKHWTKSCLYIRPEYGHADHSGYHAGEWTQAGAAAEAARSYVGRPYSFADYAAVAAHRLRNGQKYAPIAKRDRLARYVASSGRMICSQLADQALTDAGWHTFDDGRLPQDVLPAELACALLALPGKHLRPGDPDWSDNAAWPGCCPSGATVAS